MLITGFEDFPIRMDFDLLATGRETSLILTKTSTLLVIDTTQGPMSSSGYDALGVFTFTGSGVRYSGLSAPIAGTITGVKFADQLGQVTFNVSGLSLPAAPFYQAIHGALYQGVPVNPFALLLPGNDEFRGTSGEDFIIDYAGHNIFIGGPGRDSFVGGDGNDHVYGQSADGGEDVGDVLHGGGGSDYIQGNAGQDDISGGDGSDRINGGKDYDHIYGGAGNDTINGNRDLDYLKGDDGNDSIRGGQGNDTIYGGDGNDIVMGDRGADYLEGGDGNDIFVFDEGTSPIGAAFGDLDIVTDFDAGSDHLSLGFVPHTILVARAGDMTAPISVENAHALAQGLFDQHVGNHEVAIIYSFLAPLMFWASDLGDQIDSVISIGPTNRLVGGHYESDFMTSDFI